MTPTRPFLPAMMPASGGVHHVHRVLPRSAAWLALAGMLCAALPYASDADARGRRVGVFIGGVVLGAAFAPRYVYSAPYYYPPPVYYAPYPPYPPYAPAVTYVQPPVIVQQAAPVAVAPAPPAAAPLAPAQSAAAAMSLEDRLRRLRSMCEQGLFTEAECHNRREQILQEM